MVKLKKKAGVAKRVRSQHTGAFKARVALAALREDKTMAQLCQEFDLHANQITEWKRQLLERAADVFGGADPPKPVDLQPLHVKIGQLTLEKDFLERALSKAGLLGAR
jgi:transposase